MTAPSVNHVAAGHCTPGNCVCLVFAFVVVRWVQLTGHKEADFANPSQLPFVISFVGAVVLCYVVAWLFSRLQVRTASRGLSLGLLLWAGFLFFELVSFNAFELKPYELALINAGKSLVTFGVTGFVLGFWHKSQKPAYRPASYAKA